MRLFRKKCIHDILLEKNEKLEELTCMAEAASDLVTRTISGLELINQEIDDTVAEIDDYTEKLNATRKQLKKNRRRNAAVINNFSKLLYVEDEEENDE